MLHTLPPAAPAPFPLPVPAAPLGGLGRGDCFLIPLPGGGTNCGGAVLSVIYLVPFAGVIGSSVSLTLPNAATFSSNSSLILLAVADSPGFSFPLDIGGCGNGAGVSGASARCRSSSCGVAPHSPKGTVAIFVAYTGLRSPSRSEGLLPARLAGVASYP